MNKKKLNLIEKGLTLFAEKGYHATSIQEIASEAGISKGAFYLYFQSKEDFVATSIDHIYTEITSKMEQINLEDLTARKILAKQIAELISYIDQYKGFIMMYVTESISIGERMDSLIEKMKLENFHWMKDALENIYGDRIKDLLIDAVIQLDGLLNGYFKWIVMHDIIVDREETSEFIVRRLDDMVQGMLDKKESPLISNEHFKAISNYEKQDITDILHTIQGKISTLPIEKNKKDQLEEVLDTLKQKKSKSEVKPILLQGLLAHFAPYPVFHEECEQLADLWGIELLQKG